MDDKREGDGKTKAETRNRDVIRPGERGRRGGTEKERKRRERREKEREKRKNAVAPEDFELHCEREPQSLLSRSLTTYSRLRDFGVCAVGHSRHHHRRRFHHHVTVAAAAAAVGRRRHRSNPKPSPRLSTPTPTLTCLPCSTRQRPNLAAKRRELPSHA